MASLASTGAAGGTVFDAATLQDFFKGIQKYQGHSFERPPHDLQTTWQGGQARLLSGKTASGGRGTPVVLVPSMINKSDILDLLPDRSLLRWLSAHGFETHLYDWGIPVEDAGQADFDCAVKDRLAPALESLGRPAIVLGYCMGGLFASALATIRPDLVKAMILLAAPWNFHAGNQYLKNRLSIMAPMAGPYMAQYGRLPESWMQAVFASLDPESTIRKFSGFAKMEDEAKEALFVAVEDWLNDGIDLPSGIGKLCLTPWYENNDPFEGRWQVCGKTVSASAITMPTLVIAAKGDRIVPKESALAFAQQADGAKSIVCNTGHIGLLAGSKAVEQVWKPIADWCAAHQEK